MKILGIDPGIALVGLGLIEADSPHEFRALDWLCITTEPAFTLAERLQEIHTDTRAYLAQHKPDLVVIEKLYFSVNKKTALDVAQARGVLLQAVQEKGIPMLEPTPPELKSCITGDGKADKKQVQDMLMHLLALKQRPEPDDAADALALAIYGAVQGNRVRMLA